MLGYDSWGQWQFMYTAYFDDSGKESGERWVVIGGFLAHEFVWQAFAPRWAHELRRHDISTLHMKDAIQRTGEYQSWSIEKRNEVLGDFLTILKTSHLIGFAVGVDAPAWKAYLQTHRPKEKLSAMEFCFMRILRLVTDRMAKVQPPDRILLCFDTDREFASARLNLWNELRARPQYAGLNAAVSAIGFANVEQVQPLQAADMLAWLARKELVQHTGGHESIPLYKELFAALPGHPVEYVFQGWSEEEIKKHLPLSAPVASDAPPSSSPDA